MCLKTLRSTLILLAVVMLASCNATDTVVNSHSRQAGNSKSPQTTYADGARRVTIEELETLMKDGQAYVLDVRNQAMYDAGHIPGSRLIPAGEILNHLNELPHDKTIVTYCS